MPTDLKWEKSMLFLIALPKTLPCRTKENNGGYFIYEISEVDTGRMRPYCYVEIIKCIESCLSISTNPATFVQGAVPEILKNTNDDFFNKTIETLSKSADLCYSKLKEIDCIKCPHKPEGSMFVMVKLDISYLDDIQDDVEFCCKLAKEESVVILPGLAVGMKNWLRISFATEPSTLDNALDRLKSFCKRHQKQTN